MISTKAPFRAPCVRAGAWWLSVGLLQILAACGDTPAAPPVVPPPTPVDRGYIAFATGNPVDVQTVPLGGVLLAGGGTDSDAAMQWLLSQGGSRAARAFGDVVVLRTSGSNGYNSYLENFGANSVTSIVITSAAGANSEYVRTAIARAEVIFLAGGDQSTYVNLWSGTSLQTAVNARVADGYPIGGTSAGLAVLGPFIYSALDLSATSAQVLANPYDASVTLAGPLFTVPILPNLITDSHFVVRNRMGRLVAFLARLQQDGRAAAPRGIGIDERSAVGITRGGTATVFGSGNGAYLLSVSETATRVCLNTSPATPLSIAPVTALHVPVGSQFNVASWSSATSIPYLLSVTTGVLSSSVGSVY
jgi:cyanophycinase